MIARLRPKVVDFQRGKFPEAQLSYRVYGTPARTGPIALLVGS